MSTSYSKDGNYNVHVRVLHAHMPEIESLSTPRVSFSWRVSETYKSGDPTIKKPPITVYNTNRSYTDAFASISSSSTNDIYRSVMSPEPRDIISGMLVGIKPPFELDRLTWRYLNAGVTVLQMQNVDDVISKILEVINRIVATGRKRVALTVEVDKQHLLSREEFEAKMKAEKEIELAKCIVSVNTHSRSWTATATSAHMVDWIRRNRIEALTKIKEEIRNCKVSEERVRHIARSLDPEGEAIRQSLSAAKIRPRPASNASIKALERTTLEEGEDVMICVICKDDMAASKVVCMPCSHKFHESCIVQWLKGYDHRCPLCKFSLPKRERKKNDENKRS